LRAANEGGLELAGEVPGVARGLAKVGMTMIIVTHEVLYEVVVGQGPPGGLLGYPVHERTRRFLRRVAYEEDIAA
jgi:ABC-type histidine transport system ATPase subunit